ncbi:hypothetical protein A2229_02965 [Candidatus Peregrinibacteria bacterium RIFOXYA2_FULL_33_7]|nr:MAG: hypothetical protein A2229_02965 [Candidatus Peregrinibacteria bacterium RIFOXYA2_FULL_33_7]
MYSNINDEDLDNALDLALNSKEVKFGLNKLARYIMKNKVKDKKFFKKPRVKNKREFLQEIEEAREQVRMGRVFRQEDVMKEFGL